MCTTDDPNDPTGLSYTILFTNYLHNLCYSHVNQKQKRSPLLSLGSLVWEISVRNYPILYLEFAFVTSI